MHHFICMVVYTLCVFSSFYLQDQVDLAVYRSLNVFSNNIQGENLLGQ